MNMYKKIALAVLVALPTSSTFALDDWNFDGDDITGDLYQWKKNAPETKKSSSKADANALEELHKQQAAQAKLQAEQQILEAQRQKEAHQAELKRRCDLICQQASLIEKTNQSLEANKKEADLMAAQLSLDAASIRSAKKTALVCSVGALSLGAWMVVQALQKAAQTVVDDYFIESLVGVVGCILGAVVAEHCLASAEKQKANSLEQLSRITTEKKTLEENLEKLKAENNNL